METVKRCTAKHWAKSWSPVADREQGLYEQRGEVKIMMEEPTEIADLSLWELMDSEPKARGSYSGIRTCPWCMSWLFWNLFPILGCLAQP